MEKRKVLNRNLKTAFKMLMIILTIVISMQTLFSAQNFQMEWDNITIPPETWTKINFKTEFETPIIVATPEYSTTTNANGISTWITNVTQNDFMLRTTDENFNNQDNIRVHYIIMEEGAWTLPGGSNIKIEAGKVSTTKYGRAGNYNDCPSGGETVTFTNSFDSNPLVLSTRASNNNPNVWAATIQSNPSSSATVSTNAMCIRLSRSRAGTATFTNPEDIHWIAMDEGNGTLGGVEFEILWNLADTGTSGGNWINGYGDAKPFSQNWAHSWTGAPNLIVAGQTSIGGADGSWPVIYDTGNTASIRMFVDESNERAHSGSESGGGFAFNSKGNITAQSTVKWNSSTLLVGYPTINEGDESNIVGFYSYKSNNNVNLNCVSGNCSVFSHNWTTNNVAAFTSNTINFTCSDDTVGIYSAVFKINSTQDGVGDLINLSCQVFKVYGDLSVTLLSPNPAFDLEVAQNRTFTLSARVDCVGDPGTNCANVTGSVRSNVISLYGDGSDGDLIVNSLDTVINDYTYLTGNELSGDNVLTINDSSIFNNNDEILIIQMQNGTGNGIAGKYEFAQIVSISGNDITLNKQLNSSYYSGSFDTINAQVTQIVRIPQYTNVTINSGASITSPAWNGYVGGIVIFRSKDEIDFTGSIDVSEKGFRGGDCNGCGNNAWGDQGEGYLGKGTNLLTANGNGGGGSYGPSGYGGEPGAGGGYGTIGGTGVSSNGFDSIGGNIIGSSNLDLIYFGGGAGGGGDNDDLAPFPEYVDGGGAVIIFSPRINNANIYSNGETGIYPGGFGGVSGSGAGGTIWIVGDEVDLNTIQALGGPSVSGNSPDVGGAGGNGRIRVDYNTLTGSSNPAIGHTGSVSIGIGIMNLISTTLGDKSFWTNSTNPQSCGLMNESDFCILTWTINASGNINSSHLLDVIFNSNIIKVREKITQNLTVNITDNIIPVITLLNPINTLKFISNGIANLIWQVSDDSPILNCSIYINDILQTSQNCQNNINNSYNISLNSGTYNWTISAKDIDNNTAYSPVFDFTLIENYSIDIEKSIKYENTNQYKIETKINNKAQTTWFGTIIDFVYNTFVSGSFSPLTWFSNATLDGNLYGWNESLVNVSNGNVSYSISGVGDYRHKENYVVGLE